MNTQQSLLKPFLLLCLLLGLCFPGHLTSSDSCSSLAEARAWLDGQWQIAGDHLPFAVMASDGVDGPVNRYPVASTLFYLPAAALEKNFGVDARTTLAALSHFLLLLLFGLFVLKKYYAADPYWGMALIFVSGLGMLNHDNTGEIIVLLSLLLLTFTAGIGQIVGLCLLILSRHEGMLLAIPFIVLSSQRRAMVIAAAVALMVVAFVNTMRFGKAWLFGFPPPSLSDFSLEALGGIFWSPVSGFLFFCPLFLWALWQKQFKALRYSFWIKALLTASWWAWWGGFSAGPRFFWPWIFVLTMLCFPVITRPVKILILVAALLQLPSLFLAPHGLWVKEFRDVKHIDKNQLRHELIFHFDGMFLKRWQSFLGRPHLPQDLSENSLKKHAQEGWDCWWVYALKMKSKAD